MAINRSKVNTPSGFPGSKSLSKAHMPLKGKSYSAGYNIKGGQFTPKGFPGYGCVNPAHGLTKNTSKTKGMMHAEGRVGADKKGFGSGNFKQGPINIGKHGYTNDGSHYGKMKKGY